MKYRLIEQRRFYFVYFDLSNQVYLIVDSRIHKGSNIVKDGLLDSLMIQKAFNDLRKGALK